MSNQHIGLLLRTPTSSMYQQYRINMRMKHQRSNISWAPKVVWVYVGTGGVSMAAPRICSQQLSPIVNRLHLIIILKASFIAVMDKSLK
eukprot:7753339-Ditylum_brightwellii.AAC.1